MRQLKRIVPKVSQQWKQFKLIKPVQFSLGVNSKKKYNTHLDSNPYAYYELFNMMICSSSCEQIGQLLKENLHIISDKHLAIAIRQIRRWDMDLDDHFYNTILPILSEIFKNFDWEANQAIGDIIADIGHLQIDNHSIFQVFEDKLLKEKMYRYLTLEQITEIYKGLHKSQQGSDQLFQVLEQQLIKHRKAIQLDQELMENVYSALVDKGRDPEKVMTLLEEGYHYEKIQ